jgi:hypothetical protein
MAVSRDYNTLGGQTNGEQKAVECPFPLCCEPSFDVSILVGVSASGVRPQLYWGGMLVTKVLKGFPDCGTVRVSFPGACGWSF